MGKKRKVITASAQSAGNNMPKRARRGASRKKTEKPRIKSDPPGELHLSFKEPDVSSILKLPGIGQVEETDELFDHPLHSTAVSVFEEVVEEEVADDQYSERDESSSNSSDSDSQKKDTVERKKTTFKSRKVERKDAAEERTTWKMLPTMKSKSKAKQKKAAPQEAERDHSASDYDRSHVKVWDPKGLKRLARHITESDVILDEFGKIATKYKQEVKLEICRKAIDSFYIGFRDQLTSAMSDAEEVENVKMVSKINKKQHRLMQVREELIRTEPELKNLQRECATLNGRITSLKEAVQLLTAIQELQQQSGKKNSQEKLEYGVSSLPALLVESRRILRAESYFKTINSKLQYSLDFQKEQI